MLNAEALALPMILHAAPLKRQSLPPASPGDLGGEISITQDKAGKAAKNKTQKTENPSTRWRSHCKHGIVSGLGCPFVFIWECQ